MSTQIVSRAQRLVPRFLDMPDQTMAVLRTSEDPNEVAGHVLATLYEVAFDLRGLLQESGRRYEIRPLRVRWAAGGGGSKHAGQAAWGLQIPADLEVVPVTRSRGEVLEIEAWTYGEVAQALHAGSYSTRWKEDQRLRDFITAAGRDVIGSGEDEFLTLPGGSDPRILIRYRVTPARG
jgi:hypothetical protein